MGCPEKPLSVGGHAVVAGDDHLVLVAEGTQDVDVDDDYWNSEVRVADKPPCTKEGQKYLDGDAPIVCCIQQYSFRVFN